MVDAIPKPVKDLWDKWNIRGVIIFSLTLQTILIFFAPSRKRSARKPLIILIWSAYLLADWAANFAVGLISDSQGDDPKPGDSPDTKDLLAFWTPFLLLHLGGPDTITAFALEDNELWLRHMLSLVFQAVAGLYVFIRSISNALWLPTALMFVTGTIKYVERTRALYLASLDKFRDSMLKAPDPGPNYAKLMEEYTAKRESKVPTKIIMIDEPDEREEQAAKPVKPKNLTDLQAVQYAYRYYNTFKGLIVDLIFSFRERDESRDFFHQLDDEEALRILEVELSFIYQALYTKAEVLHTWIGAFFRVLALGTLVSAFVLFRFKPKGHRYDGFDVGITYALLIGGIVLDVVAILMFVFSDWTFAVVREPKEDPNGDDTTADKILNWFLRLKRLRWADYTCYKPGRSETHKVLVTPHPFRRWSGRIHIYNLIGYCLKRCPDRIHDIKSYLRIITETLVRLLFIDRWFPFVVGTVKACALGIKEGFDLLHKFFDRIIIDLSKRNRALRYVLYPVKLYVEFWFGIPWFLGFLVDYVIDFFGIKDLLDEIRFVSTERFTKDLWSFIFEELKKKSRFADDPESAKRISSARGDWTLRDAQKERKTLMSYVVGVDYDQSLLLWHIATELCYQTEDATEESWSDREFCKTLSDYMIYLLIMQPALMSAVAGIGKIRFRDTCAETVKFFERRHVSASRNVKLGCETILSVSTDVDPMAVKGDRSKSVLFDASMLAKELKRLETEEKENKWAIMSRVWVELLSYAASHCNSKTHAAQLSKGGELITFVWLLMAHFGIGEQFQIQKGDARAKLIVRK